VRFIVEAHSLVTATQLRKNRGMLIEQSARGYDETVAALIAAIERRGLTVFAQVDHAAGARGVGLELADELLVVFGNARAGTPLMQSDARVGIELPLRILVWREGEQVLLGYEDPRALAERFSLGSVEQTLSQMATLLQALAAAAGDATSRTASDAAS
jgi:uncharacterized protein (DUF302 family)